jgi:hypothetical protein
MVAFGQLEWSEQPAAEQRAPFKRLHVIEGRPRVALQAIDKASKLIANWRKSSGEFSYWRVLCHDRSLFLKNLEMQPLRTRVLRPGAR